MNEAGRESLRASLTGRSRLQRHSPYLDLGS
jgi:hypothetical protein